ncbi:hypothetical protein EBS02_08905, partial [bacterium]|nr:hypothetical protein [bacterium]
MSLQQLQETRKMDYEQRIGKPREKHGKGFHLGWQYLYGYPRRTYLQILNTFLRGRKAAWRNDHDTTRRFEELSSLIEHILTIDRQILYLDILTMFYYFDVKRQSLQKAKQDLKTLFWRKYNSGNDIDLKVS